MSAMIKTNINDDTEMLNFQSSNISILVHVAKQPCWPSNTGCVVRQRECKEIKLARMKNI